MVEYPDGFLHSLQELSRLMVHEETLENTLQRVATLVCLSVEGCDLASVTLEGPRARTAACTDKVALSIDEAQYAGDDGPCLRAFRTQTMVDVKSIADDNRWPLFAASALEHGVASSLSIPLVLRGEGRGAFNLYAREPSAFTAQDHDLAMLFAEQAAVAIANTEVYWRTYNLTQNLQAALENRDVIGQAKGILMARHGFSADEAFDELRRASQRRNVKLRDVADSVAHTGELLIDD
jgi:GAF domain-containing protein